MRIATTKNIITATAAIVKMSDDEREILLLEILAAAPATVIGVMANQNITFNGATKPTYKVVVTAKGDNKISLIKIFREFTGAGLADSKYWTEGISYRDLPAGVFAHGKTKEEADRLAADINSHSGVVRVMVLRDDVPYTYDSRWSGSWTPSA